MNRIPINLLYKSNIYKEIYLYKSNIYKSKYKSKYI